MRTQRRAARHLVSPVAATIRRFEPHLQTNLNVRRPPAAHYHAGRGLTSCARVRERLAELVLEAGWTGVQWLDRTHQASSNPSFSRPPPTRSGPPSGSSSGSYEERWAAFRFHGGGFLAPPRLLDRRRVSSHSRASASGARRPGAAALVAPHPSAQTPGDSWLGKCPRACPDLALHGHPTKLLATSGAPRSTNFSRPNCRRVSSNP